MRITRRGVMASVVPAVVAGALTIGGCTDSRPAPSAGQRIADVAVATDERLVDHAQSSALADRAIPALARAGVAASPYRATRDTAALQAGIIVGRLHTARHEPGDSAVVPTHDLAVCKPFTDTRLPSVQGGVGNAVVWLLGATTGPPPDASRRAPLTLDRCQLEPRVQRMATGGTVQVTSRDAMMSRLRFIDVAEATVRATVTLTDAGQVVPNGEVAMSPGLVEVRDDRHPWVRAYIAVASHPFVAVTGADGTFRFGTVPPGAYTLLVWSEALGVRTRAVRVTAGVETRVTIEY